MLIVEDNELVTGALRILFEETGKRVTVAHTVADAVRAGSADPPDLVLLAYGTNETTDRGQPIGTYSRDLRQVLTRLRHALPDASCVLDSFGDPMCLLGCFDQTDCAAYPASECLADIDVEDNDVDICWL